MCLQLTLFLLPRSIFQVNFLCYVSVMYSTSAYLEVYWRGRGSGLSLQLTLFLDFLSYVSVFYCLLRWLMFLLVWCYFLRFADGFRWAQQDDLEEWGHHEGEDALHAHCLFGELQVLEHFVQFIHCGDCMEFRESVYASRSYQLLV
jgi:hypothetical protein